MARAPEAWRVSIIRPFAAGKLMGIGWLYVKDGALVLEGGWPWPGSKFRVAHTDRDVEIQMWRVMVPWIGVDAVLHDDERAVVVSVSRWSKQRLFALLSDTGFTPAARWVWRSTAPRQAREWLRKAQAA